MSHDGMPLAWQHFRRPLILVLPHGDPRKRIVTLPQAPGERSVVILVEQKRAQS